jgi:hypothetical protein
MIEGCSFLFQANKNTVYHVSEGGVKVIGSWLSGTEIVALVDADKGDHAPNDLLCEEAVQLVVASSPKGADQGWIKQGGHGSSVNSLVVKLWSLKELIPTGLILALLLSALD